MAVSTKNFKVEEFACHHCGENLIEQSIVDLCQKIRDELGVPVRVNSGYRCAKHNAAVNGVRNSQHIKGFAADLSCSLGAAKMFETVKRMYEEGRIPELRYCIKYKSWIHVDTGKVRSHIFEVKS